MKKLVLLAFLVGCGGVAEDESKSSAFYADFAKNEHIMTNFNCQPGLIPVSNFQFGSFMAVHPLNPRWGAPYDSATFGVEFSASSVSSETLSMYMTTLPMIETMDGPYHILVNPWLTGLGMWPAPHTSPVPIDSATGYYKFPAVIPAWGLAIYQAGERADYPNGVALLTLDPSTNPINTAPNRFQGRCPSRRTFTFPL